MVYKIEPLDLTALFVPVTNATAALARLDERLARSPVREGFIERQHFADAAAVLWLEGELVHVEDLVLHDAHMDIRMPTHELTRAHAVLRTRRQIAGNKPDWALSADGLRTLTRRGRADGLESGQRSPSPIETSDARADESAKVSDQGGDEPDELAKAMAGIDAILERSAKVLEGPAPQAGLYKMRPADRPDLVYDADWDEDERLSGWQQVITESQQLPPVLRASILIDAWGEIEVLQHASWLGPLLVSALLRKEGLAAHHLPSWSVGAKQIPRERRRAFDRTVRLVAYLDAIGAAAFMGLKEHDRLIQAQSQMERKLKGKRSSSRLPELIAFSLSRPLITAPLVERELKVSLQGALNLVSELGLREVTGRGRYRAWGVQ